MSIINNVLKDLESCSSQFTPIGFTSNDFKSTVSTSTSKSRQPLPIILACLVLVTLGVFVWLYQATINPSYVPTEGVSNIGIINQPAAIEVITLSEPLPVIDTSKPDNQLIGMQFSESNESVSLEFALRDKVVSYLKERTEKSVVFHLKNIQSNIVAPMIRDNRWIEKLAITTQADGIDINLSTVAGVLVETQQQRLGEEIVWSITLNKQPGVLKIEPTVLAPVIQPVDINVVEQPNIEISNLNKATTFDDVRIEDIDIEDTEVKLEIKLRNSGSDTVRQLKKAQTLMRQGQFTSAELLLLALIDSPHDLAVRESLISVYQHNKKITQLDELVQASMTRYPQHIKFKTKHVEALFELNAYQRAIDFLQVQTNLNAVQLALMGASYQRLDQHKTAADFYQQSLKIDPSQSRNWIALGLSEEYNANPQQALSAYHLASKKGDLNSKLMGFIEQRSRILEKELN